MLGVKGLRAAETQKFTCYPTYITFVRKDGHINKNYFINL